MRSAFRASVFRLANSGSRRAVMSIERSPAFVAAMSSWRVQSFLRMGYGMHTPQEKLCLQ